MLEQFLNHINRNALCTSAHRVLLAVSGGLDSMVMLHLFKKANYPVAAAHCNFQLRGMEAEEDQRFVADACQSLSIPFFSKKFETKQYAKDNRLSVQVAARELRYAWFQQVMEEERFDFLATAHHVNDSLETVLLKWIHGGSLESFAGIPVKNKKVIRPLLFATRSLLADFANEHGIMWRNDSSNDSDDYQRNFIRHQVIPKLKEINPALESTFQHGLKKITGELEFLQAQLEEWKREHVHEKSGQVVIGKAALLNATFADSLLWRVVREYGFNIDQCHDMMEALQRQSGKKFIGTSHLLTLDREHIIISPYDDAYEAVTIREADESVVRGVWEITRSRPESKDISVNPTVALLDADKVTFPITWRYWQPGDSFYPLGMESRKKLSDFLIDRKIPLADKNGISVLESDGAIIWVVGHRIDNRFKITPATRSVLKFTVQPYFG
ncbi:MAG TPA: tRNA lysidine(34) synthetase TilS [Cyclobacteriaceae bacterium]|nr:tRNA lysidine(34) synthetase TilS [Cyclobacteriaceae bacterium]